MPDGYINLKHVDKLDTQIPKHLILTEKNRSSQP